MEGRRYRRRRLLALIAVIGLGCAIYAAANELSGGVSTHGARLLRYTIDSAVVHQSLPQVAVIPPGGTSARRPLLVFLHGKGETEDSNLSDQLFATLKRLGSRAPDVVFPYGGEDSYWHDRADGDRGRYVAREAIPEAERRLHTDPQRVAIGGLSMGGFGAYDIARSYPGRFCAVGGDSPALWMSGGESAEGAFDSAEDFQRNDVIGDARSSPDPYPGARLWLDVGSEDPFRAADTTFAHVLEAKGLPVQFHVWPGGHDHEYWSSHWPQYLAFYADALAGCR